MSLKPFYSRIGSLAKPHLGPSPEHATGPLQFEKISGDHEVWGSANLVLLGSLPDRCLWAECRHNVLREMSG
jgi:hypothetical protein